VVTQREQEQLREAQQTVEREREMLKKEEARMRLLEQQVRA